jgi:hypothetical protein
VAGEITFGVVYAEICDINPCEVSGLQWAEPVTYRGFNHCQVAA